MKIIVLLLVLFSVVAFGQIKDYSHFAAGRFSKAGYRVSQSGFAAWDSANNRYVDMPYASFTGGSISDIAPAGNGT